MLAEPVDHAVGDAVGDRDRCHAERHADAEPGTLTTPPRRSPAYEATATTAIDPDGT